MLAAVLVIAACGKGDGSPAAAVQTVIVSVPSATLVVGATTLATAIVTGADGNPISNAQVAWTSTAPAVVSVSAGGLITALQAGQAAVRGTSGGRSGEVSITVSNPPIASITFPNDSTILTLPNGTATVSPSAKDASGRTVANPTFFFSSDAPKVATVNQLGVITAVAAGTALISATTDNITGSMRVRVTANVTSTSPKITSVTLLTAGGPAVITGSNFAATTAGNAVLVDGVAATVTTATATQLNITLPMSGWACGADRPTTVQVNANNETGVAPATLRTAAQRSLAVGQSLVLNTAGDARCNELSATGGAYLLTVYNVARTMSGGDATFAFRGAPNVSRAAGTALATAPSAAPVSRTTYPRIGSARFAGWQELAQRARADQAHADLLKRSMEFARANGSPLAALRRMRSLGESAVSAQRSVSSDVATVGAITTIKIPNLDAINFCSSNIPVGVRTAWVGARSVIVEDTVSVLNGQPTLKGQVDSLYALIGQEFEATMYPILTQNFGNPFAMDQQLSRTGKIVMLFSPRINQMAGGLVSGFVVSCDFYPTSQAPSSNLGEFFYAISPTSLAAGYANGGTRDSWRRLMRATILHESKHITAFAERFTRNAPFEEIWLEEGLARHAEEQYARTLYKTTWKGNVGYQASVYCDYRPSNTSAPQCADFPVTMLRHFDALYQYLQSPESYSVLGRLSAADATFYGSAWSVVRWMIDQYATNEAAFLKALVQSSATGIANLEAQVSGHPWEEMLGEWALMLFADDFPGVTWANSRLKLPSWNLRDQFQGLCNDRGPCAGSTSTIYPLAYPFVPRATSFGAFSTTVTALQAGSFTSWYLGGTQNATQLLDLRGQFGGEPPGQLRLAILRIQ